MNHLDRLIQRAIGKNLTFGSPDDEAQLSHPLLWTWLTCTDAGPDWIKDPASLKVRAAPTGFIVTLSDECLGYSVESASPTLLGIFDALEAILKLPDVPIRQWPDHKPRVRKRPKST